jgi:hypothetical protein
MGFDWPSTLIAQLSLFLDHESRRPEEPTPRQQAYRETVESIRTALPVELAMLSAQTIGSATRGIQERV